MGRTSEPAREAVAERIVWSWNEWDPLEEIVVGTAEGAYFPPTEPGYQPKMPEPLGRELLWPRGPKHPTVIDKANAQLEGLVQMLEAEGMIVKRPKPLDFGRATQTPDFGVESGGTCSCPRDVMITLGPEIIEATMSKRSRMFDSLSYRHLIYEYFERDLAMQWTAAPKPSMSDSMYRPDFWEMNDEERHANRHAYEFAVTQDEVIFDAADMVRFGKDVFILESMTTNRKGIDWLRRHLAPRGLRVHVLHCPDNLFSKHIDVNFVPLRPGLVLTNPERPILDEERALFESNDWEFLDAPQPVSDVMPMFCTSSKWLSMNILSLSPSRVVVEAGEKPLIRLLKSRGFEVLDLPYRDVYEFGGSFHCTTWDIRRQGPCDDYFPSISRS